MNLLVVDDDLVDRLAVRRAVEKSGRIDEVYEASDGLQALDLLRGLTDQRPPRRPYVILLDLRLPRMGGLEFLTELRADPRLRRSIVFVLTTSRDAADLRSAWSQNVAGYILKSDVGTGLDRAIEMICDYMRIIALPD